MIIMDNKQVVEFLTKAIQSEDFKKEISKLKNQGRVKNISEAEGQKLLKETLLAEAKKLGYNITEQDLAGFCTLTKSDKHSPVKIFIAELLRSESFKEKILKLKKEGKEKNVSESEGQKLLKEIFLAEAKKSGYEFTEKDLADFSNSQVLANYAQLSSDDLAMLAEDFGIF